MNNKEYKLNISPMANADSVIQGDKYRFTVLTERLIRMEYQEDDQFTDKATQTVINRSFPVVEYRVEDSGSQLEIITGEIHLKYNKKEFSYEGLSVELKAGFGVYGTIWHYGDKVRDLRGTARTLDNVDGSVELDHGLMSREGFSIYDDSATACIEQDGGITPRTEKCRDLYYWGYGHDYLGCLKDFYRLCGETPLLPRYTMGNWWSRFYPYSEKTYLELMDNFKKKDIPFSMAVIDMDWHITRPPEGYGSGWTGYTWNRNLFPDPKGFMEKLHNRGMHITLNLHPADGVKAYEDAYLPMAKELGVNYEQKDKIDFDATDDAFMNAYFKYLHHPNEEDGVDFWWVDWQQGTKSKIPGLDTLWILNHRHFLDSGRDGKRPLTFSRYAGIGSHRYPIGFSGDSITTWESLDFQPYFTANASNAGYTWWSHDIGGHQRGTKDDNMVTRWIQFGVFSPIMRLHSTANKFYGKEPWNYSMEAEKTISDFLRLRHRLIPYLYTKNYETYKNGTPLVMPMYYINDEREAYEVPNQYYFGKEMIVCPITSPDDVKMRLGSVNTWLPEGRYYDFFTNRVYLGGKKIAMYRGLGEIPVLIPEGSIIPMAGDYNDSHIHNPKELEIYVYTGKDGSFTMYEDDCSELMNCHEAFTHMSFEGTGNTGLTIETEDAYGCIPKNRSYIVHFVGCEATDKINITGDGITDWNNRYLEDRKELVITVNGNDIRKFDIRLSVQPYVTYMSERQKDIFDILNAAQLEYDLKDKIYSIICNDTDMGRILAGITGITSDKNILGSIAEILTCDC